MIHILPLPLPCAMPVSGRRRPLLVLPAPWPPTLMWIGGGALCMLMALASLPRTAWSSYALPEQQAAVLAPAATPVQVRGRTRCIRCGVVELIRALEPVGALPAEYEFIVRMRDGSTSVSTVVASTASAWEMGDPIQLLGGL